MALEYFRQAVSGHRAKTGRLRLIAHAVFAIALVLRVLVYFGLLSALFGATVCEVIQRRLNNRGRLVVTGLAGVAAAGYLAFWVWLFSPRAGYVFSLILPLFCAGYGVFRWRGLSPQLRARFAQVFRPWLLALPATLAVLGAGFLYGGIEQPLSVAQSRFSHGLPPDNTLPLVFANQLESGRIARPMFGEWLSSDRPPLQTGFTLLLFPYRLASRTLGYLLLAVLLQSFWLPAVWVLLEALKVRSEIALWTLSGTLACGFTLLNSFFVWPKLLAGAFGLAFAGLLLENESLIGRWTPLLSGALLGFSMLAHGGVAFFAFGLAVSYPLLRRRLSLGASRWMIAGFACCYLPWFAYQKFYDPPGDFLLKMHLAGLAHPDPRSLSTVLESAYAQLTPRQILDARVANLETAFDHQAEYWRSLSRFVSSIGGERGLQAAREQRRLQFFYFIPTLGLYLLGVPMLAAGWLLRFRKGLWRTALVCWLIVFSTLIVWCALLFKSNAAVVHQGAYAAVLLAIAGSILSLWNVSPVLAKIIIALQGTLTLLVYVVCCPGIEYPAARFDFTELLVLLAGVVLFAATLRWFAMESEQRC